MAMATEPPTRAIRSNQDRCSIGFIIKKRAGRAFLEGLMAVRYRESIAAKNLEIRAFLAQEKGIY